MFAINLLLKLEQMYLENRVGIVLHRWPHTKAGHTLQHAQTFGMYLHHEDAGQRRAVVLQLDIRGGVTDLPAQAIAVHHPSADAVYSISGRVVHGDGLGRKIGYPTANIQLKHNRPPLSGIFVVQVHAEGLGVLQGVASLGVRPTVKDDANPVFEVHLFEFEQQIYGKHLRVEFLQKLRDEEKYPDVETLTRHIALDVEHAKKWFEQHD